MDSRLSASSKTFFLSVYCFFREKKVSFYVVVAFNSGDRISPNKPHSVALCCAFAFAFTCLPLTLVLFLTNHCQQKYTGEKFPKKLRNQNNFRTFLISGSYSPSCLCAV